MNRHLAAALLFAASMFAVGCSEAVSTGNGTAASASGTSGSTPDASASATMPETTMDTGTLEGSIGEGPEVVLRVEGDAGVTFSGLCNVGDKEIVLGGESVPVPERYAFDPPRGERLSCKIQKQDPGDGDLKVTLLAGDSTRSVQQINTPDTAINVSYDGG